MKELYFREVSLMILVRGHLPIVIKYTASVIFYLYIDILFCFCSSNLFFAKASQDVICLTVWKLSDIGGIFAAENVSYSTEFLVCGAVYGCERIDIC